MLGSELHLAGTRLRYEVAGHDEVLTKTLSSITSHQSASSWLLLEDINNEAEGVGLELNGPEEDITHELS